MLQVVQRLGGLWRHPEFLKLWGAHTVSALGSQVTVLALPLTAVLVLGAGPAETGLLLAARMAPVLLLGPALGVWVDRLPRRPILVAADLGSALAVGSIPAAALLGVLRLEHLYLAAFVAGALAHCTVVGGAAFVPTLVGRDRVVDANSRLAASTAV